jgi:hypothetical protein
MGRYKVCVGAGLLHDRGVFENLGTVTGVKNLGTTAKRASQRLIGDFLSHI